jgi:hypothetical protein
MLYLGIDQHARQITISLRDDGGDVVLTRQVSTGPEKIHAFFEKLTREPSTPTANNHSSYCLQTESCHPHEAWPTCDAQSSRHSRCAG